MEARFSSTLGQRLVYAAARLRSGEVLRLAFPEKDLTAWEAPYRRRVLLVCVAAGLLAQMALIQGAGFPVAAAALFAFTARGFGSARWLRDAAIGLAIGVLVFLFFVRFLNVNLPAGWLLPVLGAAGT